MIGRLFPFYLREYPRLTLFRWQIVLHTICSSAIAGYVFEIEVRWLYCINARKVIWKKLFLKRLLLTA